MKAELDSSTFIRKQFYLDPPVKGATDREWKDWIKADDYKARAHKAKITKSIEQQEAPKALQETAMVKIGGVWRQALAIAISGNEDSGYQGEPMVEAKQEHQATIIRMEAYRNKRGGNKQGRNARRRAAQARAKAKARK